MNRQELKDKLCEMFINRYGEGEVVNLEVPKLMYDRGYFDLTALRHIDGDIEMFFVNYAPDSFEWYGEDHDNAIINFEQYPDDWYEGAIIHFKD